MNNRGDSGTRATSIGKQAPIRIGEKPCYRHELLKISPQPTSKAVRGIMVAIRIAKSLIVNLCALRFPGILRMGDAAPLLGPGVLRWRWWSTLASSYNQAAGGTHDSRVGATRFRNAGVSPAFPLLHCPASGGGRRPRSQGVCDMTHGLKLAPVASTRARRHFARRHERRGASDL